LTPWPLKGYRKHEQSVTVARKHTARESVTTVGIITLPPYVPRAQIPTTTLYSSENNLHETRAERDSCEETHGTSQRHDAEHEHFYCTQPLQGYLTYDIIKKRTPLGPYRRPMPRVLVARRPDTGIPVKIPEFR